MKKIIFLIFPILLACSNQKTILNKISETDSVQFTYDGVDLKSIEVYKIQDSIVFEIRIKGLHDTINYSNKSYYNFFISSKVNDTTDLLLHVWNTETDSDTIEKRKTFYKYLLENCNIKIDKFVRGSDYITTVYPLDSVVSKINENGSMLFKFKPNKIDTSLLNSIKRNLSIRTNYQTKTFACENTSYTDFLKTNPDKYDVRGMDTSICR